MDERNAKSVKQTQAAMRKGSRPAQAGKRQQERGESQQRRNQEKGSDKGRGAKREDRRQDKEEGEGKRQTLSCPKAFLASRAPRLISALAQCCGDQIQSYCNADEYKPRLICKLITGARRSDDRLQTYLSNPASATQP